MDSISLDLADPSIIPVVLKEDLCVVEEKGDKENYQYDVNIHFPSLPIHNGDVVGSVDVIANRRMIMSAELTVGQDVEIISLGAFLKKTIINLLNGVF